MLIWRDCLEVAHEGEPFLPAEYLRYFAPALAEHAGSICGRMSAHYDVECLAAALAKALPLEQPGRLAADLRRGIAARHPGSIDSLRQVWPPRWGGRGWRQPDGSGPGFPKLLVLVCELDGSSAENVALFASDEPAIVATLVEHDAGVLALGWRPDNPSAAALYTVEAVLARLERIASSRHSVLAESARALIERR
jgi:hypothetical protein